MCNHEESTKTKYNVRNAFDVVDPDAMQHLHNADSLVVSLRLSLQALQEQNSSVNMELCNLYDVTRMIEKELSEGCNLLETLLSEIKLNALA